MKMNKSKQIIFRGGLGNQMFQYALLLALRKKGHNIKCNISIYGLLKMHNGFELSRVFGINEELVSYTGIKLYLLRILIKINPFKILLADSGVYNEIIIQNPPKLIDGYWQDERYFFSAPDEVRKAFAFKSIDEFNQQIAIEMKRNNSVSLHIRRGDYAEYGMTILGETYYRKATDKIKSIVENPVFYIFSDDTKVAEELAVKLNLTYKMISLNRALDSYKDMYLMSQCKHNIIANSSFSWWGAWLNSNPDKIVIAPSVWDKKNHEIHPQSQSWILV